MTEDAGALKGLLDFKFENLVAPKLIRVLYIVLFGLCGLGALGGILSGLRTMVSGIRFGMFVVVVTGIVMMVVGPVLASSTWRSCASSSKGSRSSSRSGRSSARADPASHSRPRRQKAGPAGPAFAVWRGKSKGLPDLQDPGLRDLVVQAHLVGVEGDHQEADV